MMWREGARSKGKTVRCVEHTPREEASVLLFGHSTHFLSRVRERLDPTRERLALALYYDAPRVRRMLTMLSLPHGVDRVALSLAESNTGPWVVVTRTGAFVTCLAVGMSLGGRMSISRVDWESALESVGRLEIRAQRHRESGDAEGDLVDRLVRGLYTSGPYITRDDWRLFEDWLPVMGAVYAKEYAERLHAWPREAERLRTRAARRDAKGNPKRRKEDWRTCASVVWGLVHSALLVALDPRLWASEELEDTARTVLCSLTWVGIRLGDVRITVLAAWSVSRMGEKALPILRDAYSAQQSAQEWMAWWVALMALGLRDERCARGVWSLLNAPPHGVMEGSLLWERWRISRDMAEPLFTGGYSAEDVQRDVVGAMRGVLQYESRSVQGEAAQFLGEGDAMFWIMMAQGDLRSSGPSWVLLLWCVAWAVRQEAPALFPSSAHARSLGSSWSGAESAQWVVRDAQDEVRVPSTRKVEKTGRNAPCVCGSGRKFKVCCGRL